MIETFSLSDQDISVLGAKIFERDVRNNFTVTYKRSSECLMKVFMQKFTLLRVKFGVFEL